jgi:hypothetical protein
MPTRRCVCVLTEGMTHDHRDRADCRNHKHYSRSTVQLAVAKQEMVWIDDNTAALNETPEAFLARYSRRAKGKGQPNLMDLEKVVNSTPIDRTARLVSEQSQSVSLQ